MRTEEMKIAQLEKQLEQTKRIAETNEKLLAAAKKSFYDADTAQLKFRLALQIYGCTDEEIEAIETGDLNTLEEEAKRCVECGDWEKNQRMSAYIMDIRKYGIDEADKRDDFRSIAKAFLKTGLMNRNELLNLWKAQHKTK